MVSDKERVWPLLVKLFAIVHRNHRPLYKAFDEMEGLSRSRFYELPEEWRAEAEAQVLEEVEREREESRTVLSGLRIEHARDLDRKVIEAMDEAVDVLVGVMRDSDSDFVRVKAVEVLTDMARNGTLTPTMGVLPESDQPKQLPPGGEYNLTLPPFAMESGVAAGKVVTLERPDGSRIIIEPPPQVIEIKESGE